MACLGVSNDSTYTIKARLDHLSAGVGCFDPIQVVHRLRGAFPELIESPRDYLWETCDYIRKLDRSQGADGALRIAVRDMQERGPKILFQIPVSDGRLLQGTAERYWIYVSDREDVPPDFRRRFTAFLESLWLQPIEIRDGINI